MQAYNQHIADGNMGSRSNFGSCFSFQSENTAQDDVQPPTETIKDRMRKLYEQRLYHDVKILVRGKTGAGANRETTFLAHKVVLAIGSEVLAQLIFGCKNAIKNGSSQILIENVDCTAFKNLIRFLYTDEVYFENAAEVLETYSVAETYAVPRLKLECANSLESSQVTADTVCKVLEISTSTKSLKMKQKCLSFIEDNTDEVLRSPSFEKATTKTVRIILKLQRLNVRSEMDVFRAVLSRAKKENIGTDDDDSYWALVRPKIGCYLKHIRFLSMSSEEFSYCLSHFKGLFSDSEALSIFMEISKPGSAKLPDWVNKGRSRCFPRQVPYQKSTTTLPADVEASDDQRRLLLICFGLTETGRSSYRSIDSLTSIVEVTCCCYPNSRTSCGSYVLKGIKLQWKQKQQDCWSQLEYRARGGASRYMISVVITPSGFNFKEKVQNIDEVVEEDTFYFTKTAYLRAGDKAKIKVEANDVGGLEFLVPDLNNMHNNMKDAPFQFELESSDADNRFIISEIYFEPWKASMGRGNYQKFKKYASKPSKIC